MEFVSGEVAGDGASMLYEPARARRNLRGETELRMSCLKLSELSWDYEAAMRKMDNSPRLPADDFVELGIRVVEARKAVSEHKKTCIFCNGMKSDIDPEPSPI